MISRPATSNATRRGRKFHRWQTLNALIHVSEAANIRPNGYLETSAGLEERYSRCHGIFSVDHHGPADAQFDCRAIYADQTAVSIVASG